MRSIKVVKPLETPVECEFDPADNTAFYAVINERVVALALHPQIDGNESHNQPGVVINNCGPGSFAAGDGRDLRWYLPFGQSYGLSQITGDGEVVNEASGQRHVIDGEEGTAGAITYLINLERKQSMEQASVGDIIRCINPVPEAGLVRELTYRITEVVETRTEGTLLRLRRVSDGRQINEADNLWSVNRFEPAL